jgi:hypothetical protein
MLKPPIDNVFQQSVEIPMGTKGVPLLVDLFLSQSAGNQMHQSFQQL